MNLHKLLLAREAAGKPLRVGLIGAGKFGSMYLSQALRTPGIALVGVADLAPDRARQAMSPFSATSSVGVPTRSVTMAKKRRSISR